MQGYCNLSCNRCSNAPPPSPSPAPTPSPSAPVSCEDQPPPGSSFPCTQQAAFGKCDASWMQGFCLQSCNRCPGAPPAPPSPAAPPGCQTLGDFISSRSELSFTRSALDTIGLLNDMKDPKVKVTFLAPVNAAWDALRASTGGISESDLLGATRQLELLLSYHVIPQVRNLSSLHDGDSLDTLLARAGGGEVPVTVGHTSNGNVTFQGKETATVVQGDLMACLAIVDEIDHVLVPAL